MILLQRHATAATATAAANQLLRRALSTDLPAKVDHLVIGGGIAGCATALALSKEGNQSILVIEQNTITSGTTWHAAGLVTQNKGHEAMVEMAKFGVKTYSEETEDREQSGFQQTGSLGLGRDPDKWHELLRATHRLIQAGVPFTTYGVGGQYPLEDAQSLHPLLDFQAPTNGRAVVGALYTPTDGIVNPADACQLLVRKARSNGAVFSERTRVLELMQETMIDGCTRVTGVRVETNDGRQHDVLCKNVVLACGQWTNPLAATIPLSTSLVKSFFTTDKEVKVNVPTAIAPHQYAIFDHLGYDDNGPKVDNSLPVVRDYDNHFYLKPEVGGLMVGEFENPHSGMPQHVAARNKDPQTIPHDAENELYEENYDKGSQSFEAALQLCPDLQEVGIKAMVHGPDNHSVDHEPLMGRCAFTENVYVATGFNSQGIQLAPGIGQAMADWILHDFPGRSLNKCDFAELDVRRFHNLYTSNRDWATTRALQGYADEYSVHYPTKEFVTTAEARGVRLSPIHKLLQERGAIFGSVGVSGWERPLSFGNNEENHSWHHQQSSWSADVESEHHAARNGCVLFDMSSFGKLSVAGKDSQALLEWATSSLIADLKLNDIAYTQMLNERGGVESDLTVVPTGTFNYYVVTGSGSAVRDADWLFREARRQGLKDVQIKEVSDVLGVLAIAGPKSREVLGSVVDGGIDALANENFPYGTSKTIKIGNTSVLALRVSYVGELGWELHVPAVKAIEVAEALLSYNSVTDDIEVKLGGYRAILNSLRTEKSFVHWGHDVGPEETPLQAGLGFVSSKKMKSNVNFQGRKVLEKEKLKGVDRRLMSFALCKGYEDVTLWGQEILFQDGKRVGKLTSGGVGYTTNEGRGIGLGYIRTPDGEGRKLGYWKKLIKENEFELEVAGRRVPVNVSLGALYDKTGENMKV